jgi:hypothetical protein
MARWQVAVSQKDVSLQEARQDLTWKTKTLADIQARFGQLQTSLNDVAADLHGLKR